MSPGKSISPDACVQAPRRLPRNVMATQGEARGVRLLVLTDVASHYFTLAGALRQLETLRAISKAQDETLRLVTARQSVGLASQFDVERARGDAERARAALPPLETLVAVSRHRIAGLMGDPPAMGEKIEPWAGDGDARPRSAPASLRHCWSAVPISLRPAHNWNPPTGAVDKPQPNGFRDCSRARCSAARTSRSTARVLGAARFGNVAGLLTMPLLNWGRTKAINEVAGAGQNEAVLQLRGRDRSRARGCRERAGRVEARAAARCVHGERRRRGRRCAGSCAVALRPRADRPVAAARCATRAAPNAPRARTTARPKCCSTACACSRRWVAGGRHSSPPPRRRQRRRAHSSQSISTSTRIVRENLRRTGPSCRHLLSLLSACSSARRRPRCIGRSARSSCTTARPVTRTATSPSCRHDMKSTRPSRSAARSSSAASILARQCAKATCSPSSTPSTTAFRRTARSASWKRPMHAGARPSRTGSACRR